MLVDNGCTSDAVERLSAVRGRERRRPGRQPRLRRRLQPRRPARHRRVPGLRQRRRRRAPGRPRPPGRRARRRRRAGHRLGAALRRARRDQLRRQPGPLHRAELGRRAGRARDGVRRGGPRSPRHPARRRPAAPTGSRRWAASASRCSPTARTPSSACGPGSAAGRSSTCRTRWCCTTTSSRATRRSSTSSSATGSSWCSRSRPRPAARRLSCPCSPWSSRRWRWPRSDGWARRKLAGWWWLLRHAGLVRSATAQVHSERVVSDRDFARVLTGDVRLASTGLSVPTCPAYVAGILVHRTPAGVTTQRRTVSNVPRPRSALRRRGGHRRSLGQQDVVLDVLFDGRRIWSFWSATPRPRSTAASASSPGRSRWRRFLDGNTRVTIRVHVDARPVRRGDRFGSGDRPDQRRQRPRRRAQHRQVRPDADDLRHPQRRAGDAAARLGRAVIAALAGPASRPSRRTARSSGRTATARLIGHDSDADLGYVSRHTHPADVILESFAIQRRLAGMGYEWCATAAAASR